MKKYCSILLTFIIVLLLSCSNDTPEPEASKPEPVARTFNVNIEYSDTETKTYTVAEGQSFTVPSVPERADGSYCGMLLSEDGSRVDNGAVLKITKDTTLSVVWSDWTFDVDPLTGLIVKAWGKSPAVVIPYSVDGIAVKGLGSTVFINRTEIKEMYLHHRIDTLEYGCLSGTLGIPEIFIPSSVETTGSYVFYQWTKDQKIVLESFASTATWHSAWFKEAFAVLEADDAITDGIGFYKTFASDDGREGLEYIAPVSSGAKDVVIPGQCAGKPVLKIGEDAFKGNSDIETLTIEEGVEIIGSNAFESCSNLKAIALPDSIRYIGNMAFKSIYGSELRLPSGVGYVGNGAFSYWDNPLAKVIIETLSDTLDWNPSWDWPEQIEIVYEDVKRSGDWEYAERRDKSGKVTNLILHDYVGPVAAELILPDEIGGVAVSEISNGLFYRDSGINKVTIPGTYKVLGTKMFYYSSLREVILEEGIETIGILTFSETGKLESITLPSTVKTIGNNAFTYSALKSITLNEGLETIGNYALAYLGGIESITLPSTLKTIGDNAFSYAVYASLTLPSGLESIGAKAFDAAKNISELRIPSSVTECGSAAFNNWTSTQKVTIEKEEQTSVWEAGWNTNTSAIIQFEDRLIKDGWYYAVLTDESGERFIEIRGTDKTDPSLTIPSSIDGISVKSIGNNAFRSSETLKAITIPSSVSSIGYAAFAHAELLESVTLNAGLEKIGNFAFQSTGIKSLTLPSTLRELGSRAFGSNKKLESVVIPESLEDIPYGAFEYCSALSSIVIPDTVRTIDGSAFAFCTSIESLSIPRYTKMTGPRVFDGWTNAQTIEIPDSELTSSWANQWWAQSDARIRYTNIESQEDGLRWKKYTYKDGTEGVMLLGIADRTENYEYTVPETISGLPVIAIGSRCFYGDDKLTKVTLPSSLLKIEGSAFAYAPSLETVVFNDKLKEIGGYAFDHSTGITELALPSSLRSIGKSAFQYLNELTSVTLPSGIESMGTEVFYSCKLLNDVTLPSDLETIPANTFTYCKALENIDLSHVKEIGAYAFTDCEALGSVNLASIENIGKKAFAECKALKSVAIGKNIRSFGSECFSTCASLETVTMEGTVEVIPYQCFYACVSLSSFSFNDGLTVIDDEAFSNTGAFGEIVLPSGLVEMGTNAFYKTKAASIFIPESVERIGWQALYRDVAENTKLIFQSGRNLEAWGEDIMDGYGVNMEILHP